MTRPRTIRREGDDSVDRDNSAAQFESGYVKTPKAANRDQIIGTARDIWVEGKLPGRTTNADLEAIAKMRRSRAKRGQKGDVTVGQGPHGPVAVLPNGSHRKLPSRLDGIA